MATSVLRRSNVAGHCGRRWGVAAVLVVLLVGVLLSTAAAAYAEGALVSYKDPKGGTSTETGGTVSYEGSGETKSESVAVDADG